MKILFIKKVIKKFSLLIVPFTSIIINAQISENDPAKYVPNIIPPSPTAYGLGTYGNTPIGLFTGSQNISIPIYTYKTANLEVPISMCYSSNGIRVDEISSNVGQSWNLNFGGVISRVVRDKPDETRGDFPIPISITEQMGRYSPPALDFYQYIGENDVDSEADIFNFNFGKYSGKFIFSNGGGVVLMPAQELKVEYTLTSESINFIITAPDGIKYYFDSQETSTQRVLGSGHSIPNITVSSWYLSKIVHPKGDEIQFTYDDTALSYITSKSQTFRMLYPRIQYDAAGNLEQYNGGLSSMYEHTMSVAGKAVKSIKSTNPFYGEVAFTYLANSSADVTSGNNKISQITIKDKAAAEIDRINFTYTTTSNSRVFLDKIQFKDPNQNYQFEYLNRNSFPARLSLSQDHWGYYNGKTNVNIVPAVTAYELEAANYNGANKDPDPNFAKIGLLTKIIYPTKGYTTFDYEPNDYYGQITVQPSRLYQSISAVTLEETNSASSQSMYTNGATAQNIPIIAATSFYCSDPDLNVGKNKATISVYNTTAGRYETLYRTDNGAVLSSSTYQITPTTASALKNFYFAAAANQTYRITLSSDWYCTSSTLNYNYLPEPVITNGNIVTGGIRVQRTSDYASSSSAPVIKRFLYAKKGELAKSTGNKGQDPYYIDTYKVEKTIGSGGAGMQGVITTATYLNLSSSSLSSLFDTGSSNVFYNYVTISYGSDSFLNGGEEHEFIVHRDGGGGFVVGTYETRSAPLSNLGWDNGLLKKTTYFNKDLKTVKETINEYEEKTALRQEFISYSARKNYEKIASSPVTYECTSADLTRTTPYRTCIADHNHIWQANEIFFGDGIVCIAPGHDNKTIYFPHPCYGATLPKTITNLANIDNLSIVAYKNIMFWHYLKSTQDITYDTNGNNPVSTTTNYNYRGINHTLLSSQASTNSNLETLETKYFYPKDAEMAGEPVVNDLIAANMVGTPLDTQTFRNTVKLSEQKTGYEKNANTSNLLLPRYIYANKGISAITLTADKKITFDQYDDKGNLVQYTLESGIPVSIIWGYNKTKPIAKIENALYSTVSGYVSNLQTKSDTDTETNLITALNSLRTSLPNTMITTYTYKLLVGLSTVTDSKGYKTTYSYDNNNRLETVRDNAGNIISENQYNFKQ